MRNLSDRDVEDVYWVIKRKVLNVSLVINGDKKLTIDTTVQMEASGQFEVACYGISARLDDLLSEAEDAGK